MKTDAQRLELVLKFVNGGDVERANQRELRANLAEFLGYPLLADGEIFPGRVDPWPPNIGGTGFEVSAHVDMTDFRMHMSYKALDGFIWCTLLQVTGYGASTCEVVTRYTVQESLAAFLGFGPEAVPVPVGVLRQLQNRTRQLIHRHLGSKNSVLYVNELAEQLDGTPTLVGRGAKLRTDISAELVDAYLWIVLLLVTGQPAVRACANSKCERLFVATRKTRLYCSDRCGQAVRDRRHYSKPETRKRKVEYLREKRASERR